MWFDSHCHLHICEENAPVVEVISRATRSGVLEMTTIGIDVASSRRAVEIAEMGAGIYASVGLHPNSATEWDDTTATALEELLQHERVVGVGESGLDFYRDSAPPEVQREVFAAHIELAKTHDKALVIHTRESLDDALDVLAELGPPARLVFHCWSGDAERQLTTAVDLGAYISFAGNVSFKNADNLRTAATAVPHDRLLVETDSPYLTPVPHRGKPNEPRQVTFVGLTIAQAREQSVHLVAEQTTQNARRLFL
ncbi:MAG: TatD family hydrolase [Actinomycetota bacterium]